MTDVAKYLKWLLSRWKLTSFRNAEFTPRESMLIRKLTTVINNRYFVLLQVTTLSLNVNCLIGDSQQTTNT